MITTEMEAHVDHKDLEQKVKMMYEGVANHPDVEYHFEMGRSLAERLGYPKEILDKIPKEAIESFAGVGYFFDLLDVKKGQSIVDLGSGSGLDTFYAAQLVGNAGEVTGLDMTLAQLQKAKHLREQGHFDQVYFLESYIEELNIRSESIDSVISNGVINLSSKKQQVFNEVARVLKPGGSLVISDIVSSKHLPDTIVSNATLWAACIGGAVHVDDFLQMIESAGLRVEVTKGNPYRFISKSARYYMRNYGVKSISIKAVKPIA